jgi:O-antigen/teichoic acid export membrane protein
MPEQGNTTARKILKNSFWFGVESVLETVVFLFTSIAVARYLGPQKLGYYSYINFFVGLVTSASSSGLASATNKFMSQYLAVNRPGMARAVYHLAYRYQLTGALTITAAGLASIYLFGDPSFRSAGYVLILAITPGVMSWVPGQANAAFEDAKANTLSALGFIFGNAVGILLTLYFHWDLVGIAGSFLAGRLIEVLMRTIPLHAKLRRIEEEPMEAGLAAEVRRFCFEAIGVQIVTTVVWGRSEMIFLRAFSTLEQIGFYSLSVGFVAKLTVVPEIFANATCVSLMVEALRDRSRVATIVNNASRFLFLIAVPIHMGAAAIAIQATRLVYGPRYEGAGIILVIASILAIPHALQSMPTVLLRSADRQKQLLLILIGAGVGNMLLDYVLVKRYNAVGAAWGNGIAQAIGVALIWITAQRYYAFRLPTAAVVRLTLAGGVMALAAYGIVVAIPGFPGLGIAIVSSVPVYVLMVKLIGGLDALDEARMAAIGERFPPPLRKAWLGTVSFVTPSE